MSARPLRRRDAGHQWSLHFGPNMTPMVDVVIVILIFFMSATAIMGPEWFLRAAIPALPGAAGADADPFDMPPPTLRIELDRAGDTTIATGLGLIAVPLEEMGARLEELAQSVTGEEAFVLLVPAPEVAYRDVVRLRDLCERAGLTDVGLSER